MLKRSIFLLSGCLLLSAFAPHDVLAQPKVLAELFCNTNCGNCADPDNSFDAFLAANPSYGIVRISYHNDITNPQDTFYLASKVSTLYRSGTFYNIQADPTGIINGQPAAGSASTWETLSQAKALNTAPIQLTATSDGEGVVHIHVLNPVRPGVSVRLYVALTESNIVMDNSNQAYKNPPSGHWDDIFRKMLPSPQGTDAFTPNGADTLSVTFDPTVPDYWGKFWNPQNMRATAYLQDDQGTVKKIEAIGTISLANLSNAVSQRSSSTAHLRIFANPTPRLSQIGLSIPSAGRVRVTLSDLLGRSVRTVVDGAMPSGEGSIDMDGITLASGCYIVRMFVGGTEADHAKVIVE